MKFLIKITLLSSLIVFSGCAGIEPITPKRVVAEKVDTTKLYDQNFLVQVNSAKEKYRKGKADLALKELSKINDKKLNGTEKASKRNLIGVILFSKKEYLAAVTEFDQAILTSANDPYLTSQINLNLGSARFKLNQNELALAHLNKVDYGNLSDSEARKFHQLHAILSEQLGKKGQGISSMIRALSDKKTIEDLRLDPKYVGLEEKFFALSESERVRMLEGFDDERNLVVLSLSLKSIDQFYKNNSKDKASDMESWLLKRYADHAEVKSRFEKKSSLVNLSSESKVNPFLIGVALPISGDRKSLGERALNGIDVALLEINEGLEKKFQIIVSDTQSQAVEGAFAVSELIEKSNVVAVIGGLNPSSATKEYLEAKKRGVLFISLSPVYLPKDEKNHLLIEISGSIESQVDQLFKDDILARFGKRPAIIYPRSELGEAYANEFWRRSKLLNLDVTSIASYDRNASDFKDPVKHVLGIKHPRERLEELNLVADIARLEQNKNVKRLQNLQAQIDFDWVFAPGLPREMVQILPNFNFYDAFNLNYFGVPSWRSELMSNEGYRYGNVFFIDEDINPNETVFTKNFFLKFSIAPKFVETISYDSLKVIAEIVKSNQEISARSDLDVILQRKEVLTGESGTFKLNDGVWLKNLAIYKIKRDGIEVFKK